MKKTIQIRDLIKTKKLIKNIIIKSKINKSYLKPLNNKIDIMIILILLIKWPIILENKRNRLLVRPQDKIHKVN